MRTLGFNDRLLNPYINGFPSGPFPPETRFYYKEPVGGSDATERYQWNMDGQDDFTLRNAVWICTNPVIEGEFIGKTTAATYFIFDGDSSGVDRAYLFINANTGFLNCAATTIELNGVVIADNTVAGVEGEINHFKLTFTGTYRVQVRGARYSLDQLFSPTAIPALYLIDPLDDANTDMTRFSSNGSVETSIGHEMGEELWVSPTLGAEWVDNGGGSYTFDSPTGADSRLSVSSNSDAGSVLCAFKLDLLSGSCRLSVDGSTAYANITPGVYDVEIIASADGVAPTLIEFLRHSGGVSTEFTVSNITFKELPASAWTHNNGEPDGSDLELIERESDNSGWVGENLITQAVFDAPAAANDQWTQNGDVWQYVGDGSFNALEFLDVLYQPEAVDFSFTVSNFTGDGTATCVRSGSGGDFAADGDYIFRITKSVDIGQQFKRDAFTGGTCSFDISNVKSLPIYDYATGAIA